MQLERRYFSYHVGSTPRVWRIALINQDSIYEGRFNPTCVENRKFPLGMTGMVPVQPHVCGE